MNDEYILEMRNITKSFGGIHALNNVSLNLRRGEVLCLCGENGAGKSTLMNILSGVIRPSNGEIFIEGKKVNIKKPIDSINLGISMVHQELIQIDDMTVAENVFVGRYKSKLGLVDDAKINRDTEALMERLGVHFPPTAMVRQYGIAQKQLIEILKALSYDSKIIVFDEPTAALSLEETEKLYKIIRQLKQEGIAVILISHRMEDIFSVGDRVEVLKDGEVSGGADVSDVTVDDLIRMMVGRKITQQFPEKTNNIGDVIFKAQNIKNSRVKGVSFSLHKGEILGIGGLVGAGRTELLRAIFGLDPCEGELYLRGEKITNNTPSDAIKKGFALVPEDRKGQGLIMEQSIVQNVVVSILKQLSRAGFMNHGKEVSTCNDYRNKLNIRSSSENMMVRMLSGGNQQKVVISKCLASAPDILLLDEPTRGVDVGAKAEIYKIINDLATAGLSIIVVSSEMTELLGISDRIIVLSEGYYSGELSREEASEESIMHLAIAHSDTGRAE